MWERAKRAYAGSSPRVWGTRVCPHNAAIHHRFIPACVGNSTTPADSTLVGTVHPRVCGELTPTDLADARISGSSPRVWGTRYRQRRISEAINMRFIPACVGNSIGQCHSLWDLSVHPRVCGELVLGHSAAPAHLRFIPACVGNSLQLFLSACQCFRFIPACVGNSSIGQCHSIWRLVGSSPRVWGTRLGPS